MLWGLHRLSCAPCVCRLRRYKDFFDAAFVSTQHAHNIEAKASHLHQSLRAGCRVAVETARFVLELTNEQKEAYIEKVAGFGEAAGWKRDRAAERRQETLGKHAVQQQVDNAWERGCPFLFFHVP